MSIEIYFKDNTCIKILNVYSDSIYIEHNNIFFVEQCEKSFFESVNAERIRNHKYSLSKISKLTIK